MDDEKRLVSSPNAALSKLGKQQVKLASRKLAKEKIDKIFHSKYKRARQSAQIVAKHLGVKTQELDFLHEKPVPSEFYGLHREDKEQMLHYERYKEKWPSASSDDNETFSGFVQRIDEALKFMRELEDGKTYLFVSHDLFIRSLFFRVVLKDAFDQNIFRKLYESTRSEFAGISLFEVLGDKVLAKTLSDSSHLRKLRSSKKLLTIGGGTGQYTLLKGLKNLDFDLTAVVSMADDGGTTGVLRDELGVLPPTDVRKCIVALSDAEPTLRKLFTFRFANRSLKGHTVGNLILTALEKINKSFAQAVKDASDIFHIRGEVLPVTDSPKMRLSVLLKNGEELQGEKVLDENPKIRKHGVKEIKLKEKVKLSQEVKESIEKADYIVIGPGDLYGSILPNFLVSGMREALSESDAKIIYVANLTNKKGQNEGFNVCDYLKEIEKYAGVLPHVLLCSNEKPNSATVKKYEEKEGRGAIVECPGECDLHVKIKRAKLLSKEPVKADKGDDLAHLRSFLRHDPDKLAKAIEEIIDDFEYRAKHS